MAHNWTAPEDAAKWSQDQAKNQQIGMSILEKYRGNPTEKPDTF